MSRSAPYSRDAMNEKAARVVDPLGAAKTTSAPVAPCHCDRFNGASLGNANKPADKKHLDIARRNFNRRVHLGSLYDDRSSLGRRH